MLTCFVQWLMTKSTNNNDIHQNAIVLGKTRDSMFKNKTNFVASKILES